MKWIKIGTLLILGTNAWKDIRTREVNLVLIILLAVTGLLSWIWKREDWLGTMMVLCINLMLIGFSILSKGAFGMGDALLLTAVGTVTTMEEYTVMICLGLVLASVWSLFLLFGRKKGRQEVIPLVPFFLLGYIGGLLL